jgi:hypothetical protein
MGESEVPRSAGRHTRSERDAGNKRMRPALRQSRRAGSAAARATEEASREARVVTIRRHTSKPVLRGVEGNRHRRRPIVLRVAFAST